MLAPKFLLMLLMLVPGLLLLHGSLHFLDSTDVWILVSAIHFSAGLALDSSRKKQPHELQGFRPSPQLEKSRRGTIESIEALTISNTVLGVPYHSYSIMGPKNPSLTNY